MTPVELERSRHHCCSCLHRVLAASSGVAHSLTRVDRAHDMMPVELGPNNHRCLSFARRWSTRSCCSGSAKSISM